MKHNLDEAVICVIGLGYVGLPLAEAFSRIHRVIGFDTDVAKVNRLRAQQTRQATDKHGLSFTASARDIGEASFHLICVPTPLTASKEPDLSYVRSAAEIVGQNMKRGSTVVLESSVYPGVTEEVVKPVLEEKSGMTCGRDFRIGYSPERVNPGDKQHQFGQMTKIVSGMDAETAGILAQLYGRVTAVFIAKDIRTAEAAKVVENIQRDLNIALMNELSLVFERIGLSTTDVLEAAATKWNFHRYAPGLVGGHCIPVVPHFLAHKAREHGYTAQVILAARAVNDLMPGHVAEITTRALGHTGKVIRGARVLILGLTYKENVPDTRGSQVQGIVKALEHSGVEVYGYDPVLGENEVEFDIRLVKSWEVAGKPDAVIVAIAHDQFRAIKLSELKAAMNNAPVLTDIKRVFDRGEAEREGFCYRTL